MSQLLNPFIVYTGATKPVTLDGTYALSAEGQTVSGTWEFSFPAFPACDKNPRGRTLEQIIKGTVYDRCGRRGPRRWSKLSRF